MKKFLGLAVLMIASPAFASVTVCTAFCARNSMELLGRQTFVAPILGRGDTREAAIADLKTKCPLPNEKKKDWVVVSSLQLINQSHVGVGQMSASVYGVEYSCIEL